jgi:serine protease Do
MPARLVSMARRLSLLSAALVALACQGGAPSTGDAQRPGAAAPAAPTTAPALPVPTAAASVAASRRTAITEAVTRVAPAVVTVQTETVQRVANTDPFEMFFGGRGVQERRSAGIGSGFIVTADGVIVTNAHVVSGASVINVALRDGTTYKATLAGLDELNDLAVLRIDAKGLPTAPVGSSSDLVIGEWAIAIGNPYGFILGNTEPSVTAGVISATGRNLVGQSEGGGATLDLIQTDASINPGNSGGPLVNAEGKVIGVNTVIYSPSGGSIGIGFAIPIDRAMRVADDLIKRGAPRRPWIGVRIQQPQGQTPRDVVQGGVIVRSVVLASPAAKAGIKPGDRILQSRGRSLRNIFDWETELLDLRVGESVPLVIERDGEKQTVRVVPADLPEVGARKVEVLREVQLVTLTPQIRDERGIRSARGAVIVQASERVMEQLGVQPGDVIIAVNRFNVTSAEEAARALDALAGRGLIRLVLERRGYLFTTDFYIQ